LKRRQLIQDLHAAGCHFLRAGGRHDLYVNPATGKVAAVPRHTEVKEYVAKKIKKDLGAN
jgi:mRNA interferase HicA